MNAIKHSLLTLFICFSPLAFALDCDNANTTLEMNDCAAREIKKAQATLDTYFAKAVEILKESDDEFTQDAVAALEKSQASWSTFRDDYCDAIYTQWQGGSIRSLMAGECRLSLTQQRTYQLWGDYLTTMDGHNYLPEPKKP